MTRMRILLTVILVLVVAITFTLILAGNSIQRSFFYPKPSGLPPVVSQTTTQLLSHLESILQIEAPSVARALQPGLSDAQIANLEIRGGFHLSSDLHALYRWHNGMRDSSRLGLLPGQRFVPLDEFLHKRSLSKRQLGSSTKHQQAAFSLFAGHTRSWIQVLDDGAGDGYFYDPERRDSEGAFFYHFAETGSYLWFPSLRNFLAGVIECYESHAVKVATDGKILDEDFERTQKIWSRYTKSNEGGS